MKCYGDSGSVGSWCLKCTRSQKPDVKEEEDEYEDDEEDKEGGKQRAVAGSSKGKGRAVDPRTPDEFSNEDSDSTPLPRFLGLRRPWALAWWACFQMPLNTSWLIVLLRKLTLLIKIHLLMLMSLRSFLLHAIDIDPWTSPPRTLVRKKVPLVLFLSSNLPPLIFLPTRILATSRFSNYKGSFLVLPLKWIFKSLDSIRMRILRPSVIVRTSIFICQFCILEVGGKDMVEGPNRGKCSSCQSPCYSFLTNHFLFLYAV